MILDQENERVFLKVRDPEPLLTYLPDVAEPVRYKGHNIVVDPLTLETWKVLRNLGLRVPSPMRFDYDWPGRFTPLQHQIETAEFCLRFKKGFILNDMGTMKTASVLWAIDYMMQQKMVTKTLIVAPLSTVEDVWQDEVFNVCMHRTAVILRGSAERRLELLATGADIYIINYEGLEIIWRQVRKRKDINLVVVDEAAAYRNGNTVRYETLNNMLRRDMRLLMLTGTPCPNAPTDAWALAKLVDPLKVPVYFTTWKRKVMQQVTTYKWRPQPGSHELVYQVLQPAIRFRKEDCIDLPPVVWEKRAVGLTKEQNAMYRTMKQFLVAEADGREINAVNAADKITKLRQILAGAVRHPETGEYITLDHQPRLDVLRECIEQASAKVLVIVPFKGITYTLQEELAKDYSVEVVNGDVSQTRRTEIFRRFKREKDPHVLLCHPKVMAHGLTLVQADTLIFYAPIYSNELMQQVTERINRPGQVNSMTMVRMGANALEWGIYAQVEGNRMSQETILELYRREFQMPLAMAA
jgi:SNF2 family DNA or RNA helicase